MGERSRALDALVIAMGDNTEVDENDCAPELRAWVQHWWRKLEPSLIQEEAVIQQVGRTVEDSLESVDSGGGARFGENRAKEASGKEDCVDTDWTHCWQRNGKLRRRRRTWIDTPEIASFRNMKMG